MLKYPKLENYVSKHLYECSKGTFKITPIYQTDDYSLLQIKEKNHSLIWTYIRQNFMSHTRSYIVNIQPQTDTHKHKYTNKIYL